MQKTKNIIVLVIASVLLIAIAGIAYAQIVSAQSNTVAPSSTPQGITGSNGYPNPQQGYCYGYGQQYSSGCGCRMSMCNPNW